MTIKPYKIFGWILFYGFLIFLTFNKHSRSGYNNYHSEIWADKAGYYVYLPATFKYNFQAEQFPDSIDFKTGHGFHLDPNTNKVQTKYTYGVSFLQAPFYFVADILSPLLEQQPDGFSPIYHSSINFAAISYFLLGLILLNQVLKIAFNKQTAIFVLLSIFLGTNLFYYVVSATGMSHVYSFFLFSLLLNLLVSSNFLSRSNTILLLFLGIIGILAQSHVYH